MSSQTKPEETPGAALPDDALTGAAGGMAVPRTYKCTKCPWTQTGNFSITKCPKCGSPLSSGPAQRGG